MANTTQRLRSDEMIMLGMDSLLLRSSPSLVRDILGNPFRPNTAAPAWLAWNGGTVPKLAQAIYHERVFDRLPLLADALQDAGCENEEILSHCRRRGEHVRGCWLIDILLDKI
jgi:hypothetical protein